MWRGIGYHDNSIFHTCRKPVCLHIRLHTEFGAFFWYDPKVIEMSASIMLRLRKGERYKKAKHFKPFVRESVSGYLLGTSFKTKKALAEALEAADPHAQPWGRTRLAYQIDEAMKRLTAGADRAGHRTDSRC